MRCTETHFYLYRVNLVFDKFDFIIESAAAVAASVMSKVCDPTDCSPPPGSSVHGFSRQECWSGLPCPSLGDFPHPGIKTRSPALQADSLPSEPPEKLHEWIIQQVAWSNLTAMWIDKLMSWTNISYTFLQFSSVTPSCLTLQPHGVQHTRPPCLSPTAGAYSNYIHWVGDAIQPSHPLSSPSPPAFNLSHHQGLFKWVISSHQVAKVLELQLQHQSFHEYSGLISFRMDWLDLLADTFLK